MTGRTQGLGRSWGSWSEQENRKQCAPGLKCSEKQIKAHICHLPRLPALSCLDLKVIGSQGGDSWRKLRGGESIYLQWDAAMLVQDAVSRRMCPSPPLSTHTHLLPSFSSPPSHYNPQVWSSQKSGKWVIREAGAGGWPAAGTGRLHCVSDWAWTQPAESSFSMSSCPASGGGANVSTGHWGKGVWRIKTKIFITRMWKMPTICRCVWIETSREHEIWFTFVSECVSKWVCLPCQEFHLVKQGLGGV